MSCRNIYSTQLLATSLTTLLILSIIILQKSYIAHKQQQNPTDNVTNDTVGGLGMIYVIIIGTVIGIILVYNYFFGGRRGAYGDSNDSTSQQSTSSTISSSVPASGDSDSVPLPTGDYEVFLSFRGPDTRHYVTDILYRFLLNLKIRTFRDDDELRKGEGIGTNLLRAISQSKIHVPILSQGYAHSKWCLNELVEIIEQRKQGKGHIILPIFYLMDPRDVRHQTGPYQSAFKQHKRNKVDENTIQSWKDALNEVGTLKGWHLQNKEEVGALVDEVSSVIWSHLSKEYTLDTDELVGIDNHVEVVVKKLSNSSEDVRMVGINGLGGIGKTTLAKAVYNKISYRFERCCFVENVRETQKQKDGTVVSQRKLISDILSVDSKKINDSSEAKKTIRERVSQFKLLVVLDDVDEKFKFEDILGSPGDFIFGSTFLFTSRNIKVLSTINESRCVLYEVGAMSHQHSLQLLCRHAFHMDSPPSDYEIVANKIVSTTGGLPLTLKVLGSLLHREDIDFWEEKLLQLQGTVEVQVMERLKISYDALPYQAQQIFLDVACFFIGKSIDMSSYLWSDCKLYPVTNIRILVQRSMIKMGDGIEFQMHDQLRDMGREIVRQEDIDRPWMRSRIWAAEEAIETLSNKKGSDKVKAIRVGTSSSTSISVEELRSEYFSNLPELKYLDVGSSTLTGDFNNLLPNMRWLRLNQQANIQDCPFENFDMKNVVILDLEDNFMDDDWGGWSQIKTAGRLKYMDISGCWDMKTIPYLPRSLEIFILGHFFNDQEVLNIDELQKLKWLLLKWSIFGEIKGTIGMLKDLRCLVLVEFKCGNLREFLADIGELPSLIYLHASDDGVLEEIKHPVSLKGVRTGSSICNLAEMSELEDLTMEMCGSGLEIPCDSVWWKESKLKILTLESTMMRRSSSSGGDSDNMATMVLPSSLTSLDIYGSLVYVEGEEYVWLPSTLENLENLTRLSLKKCPNLGEIHGIEGLKSLESLELDDLSSLTSIQGLEHLIMSSSSCSFSCKLQKLVVSRCQNLTQVLSFHDVDYNDQTEVVCNSLQ